MSARRWNYLRDFAATKSNEDLRAAVRAFECAGDEPSAAVRELLRAVRESRDIAADDDWDFDDE